MTHISWSSKISGTFFVDILLTFQLLEIYISRSAQFRTDPKIDAESSFKMQHFLKKTFFKSLHNMRRKHLWKKFPRIFDPPTSRVISHILCNSTPNRRYILKARSKCYIPDKKHFRKHLEISLKKHKIQSARFILGHPVI